MFRPLQRVHTRVLALVLIATAALRAAAAVDSAAARDLYGADYVLIRPDQHIAWRGNTAGQDLKDALMRALGAQVEVPAAA